MKHEKIFKRENGTQYKIMINLYINPYEGDKVEYRSLVITREKRKRNWQQLRSVYKASEYRNASMEERRELTYKNTLLYVTEEEIQEVKLELHEKIKPIKQ